MKLSKTTIALGIYIVISAVFMLQVRNWLFNVLGKFAVITGFRLCLVLISIFIIIYAFRLRLSWFRICIVCFIFILGYIFSAWQPYFSEKTHVLTYGLLGYLATNDLTVSQKSIRLKGIILALVLVSLISGLDETFQWLLPYRVGELRDFFTNIISGLLGMSIFSTLNL